MKKSFLALLGVVVLTTGCNSIFKKNSDKDAQDPSKLKIRFHVDSKSKEGIAYKKVIDNFNSKYASKGYKVTPAFVARSAGDSQYEKQLSNDMVDGTLPDIVTFDAPNCAAYAHTGYFYDITNSLTEDEKKNFITLNKYDGKLYGIPIQESSAGFYYNKAMFADAGIDVSGITVDNPWTITQFEDACQKLKNKGYTPVDMRIDATKDETATYLLYPFVYAFGGSFVDSTGKKAVGYFNTDNSKKTYRFIKGLISSGYTSNGIGATDFFTKKVGMYLSSGWTIPQIEKDYKEYFADRSTWGLLPYPKEAQAASANGSWSYAVTKNKRKDKTPVIALLKHLTSAESSKIVTDATGMIPANKSVATNYEAGSPEDILYQQLQKTSKSRPVTVAYPKFSTIFGQAINEIISANLDAVSGIIDNKASALEAELKKIK